MNDVSPWVVALVIVAAAEIYSIGLMLLCRRRWGTDRLSLNNEVAGFKFAVIGVSAWTAPMAPCRRCPMMESGTTSAPFTVTPAPI